MPLWANMIAVGALGCTALALSSVSPVMMSLTIPLSILSDKTLEPVSAEN